MDQNNKNTQEQREASKIATGKIVRIASVMIAVAIIGICFAYTKLDGTGIGQIAMYVISALSAFFGAFIIFIMAYGTYLEKHRGNFFLYDKKKKINISIEELTIERVRERLILHMSIFKRNGKLYVGDLFDSKQLLIPEVIKPLFCYELLCEIADDNGANASAFLSFGAECAEVFSKYLGKSGDYELALKIKQYFFSHSEEQDVSADFREYVISQREHIENQMLNYTKENIEKFN